MTNEGSEPISDLKINFKGGNKTLSELGVGSTHKFIVKSTGESDITVSFLDAKGNARNYRVDVYFETNYQGRIDIKVDRLDNITWRVSRRVQIDSRGKKSVPSITRNTGGVGAPTITGLTSNTGNAGASKGPALTLKK